jgi:DNA primase
MDLEAIFTSALNDRCISADVARIFELGLISPDGRAGYFNGSIPIKFLKRTGLIFPVKNVYNKIESYYFKNPRGYHPKYDSLPFEKNLLFGLHASRGNILDSNAAILVEGPMDMLSLLSNGFSNAVALLGTSLKFSQMCLLRRFTTRCYVLLDGDPIGKSSACDIRKMLEDIGMSAHIVTLPDGMDPDDFLKKYGPDELKKIIYR